MADEINKRDANAIPVTSAVTDNAAKEVVQLRVDPVTNRLKVDASMSSDIEIGAVEIKDGATDTRAVVGANGLEVNVKTSVLPTGASTETTLSALNAKLVSGTDIGDVTINNAGLGSAVNIQDGGNSITTDNPVLTDGTQKAQINQNVVSDNNNSSTTNIASGAVFTGLASSTLGVAGIQVSLRTDQNCKVYIDQAPTNALVDCPTGASASTNNTTTFTGTNTYFTKNMAKGDTIVFDPLGTNQTRIVDSVTSDTVLTVTVAFTGGALNNKLFRLYPWDLKDEYDYFANSNFGTTIQAVSSFTRVRVQNTSGATTTYFRLQTALCPIVEALPRSLDDHGHLKTAVGHIEDEHGFQVENTPNGEMRTISPVNLVGASFAGSTIDPNYWVVTNTAGGTSLQANGRLDMLTNTTANGQTFVASVRKARYSVGCANRYRSNMRVGDTGTTNNIRKWGVGLVGNYTLTVGSATVVAGDTYSDISGVYYIVLVSGTGTSVVVDASGTPTAGARTYTLISGTGAATLTGSAFAVSNVVTDGFYFQLSGTTFSVVSSIGGTPTPVSTGSFNGQLGTTFVPSTNVTTYEIYYNNQTTWFVIDEVVLHSMTGLLTPLSNSMTLKAFYSNANINDSVTNVGLYARSCGIKRLGTLSNQPISKYQTGTATAVLKYGSGNLHAIVTGSATGSCILYDGFSAVAPVIASLNPTVSGTYNYMGLPFYNGLTAVTSGAILATIIYE